MVLIFVFILFKDKIVRNIRANNVVQIRFPIFRMKKPFGTGMLYFHVLFSSLSSHARVCNAGKLGMLVSSIKQAISSVARGLASSYLQCSTGEDNFTAPNTSKPIHLQE